MFNYFRNFFKKSEPSFQLLAEIPSLHDAIQFSVPNEDIHLKVRQMISDLENSDQNLVVEKLLKEKELLQFSSLDDLMACLKNDFELNYQEYSNEFLNEPLDFTYFLGNRLITDNSVEIIQKIFHTEREDVGNIYNSIVIKYHKRKYYYWKW